MDYRGFWNLVRARWLVLITFALLGTIGAAGFTLTRQVDYSARAELFVASVGSDNSSDLAQGGNYSQQQARIYSVVATREVVLGPVIETLGLDTTAKELASRVTASVPLNTSLITIEVSDTSPARAADTANSIATSLVNTVIRLVPKRTDGTTPVRLETIQSATAPSVSSAPGRVVFLVGGLLAGIVAGLAFILLRELSSTRVRTAEQILQVEDLPLLGSVVHDRRASSAPLVPPSGSGTPRFEEYRQIRTNLPTTPDGPGGNIIVITSAIPGEGRSITAANLALAIAATNNSICLVEGDLRRPSFSDYFAVSSDVGLSDVLRSTVPLDDALVKTERGVALLPAGSGVDNPSELLASDQTTVTLAELSLRFDIVLVDTPAILPVTDAAILAKSARHAILVVGASQVELREFQGAVDALAAANATVIGVVLNDVPARAAGRYRGAYARRRFARSQGSASRAAVPAAAQPGSSEHDSRASALEVGGASRSPIEAKAPAAPRPSANSTSRTGVITVDPGNRGGTKTRARPSKTYRVSKDSASEE